MRHLRTFVYIFSITCLTIISSQAFSHIDICGQQREREYQVLLDFINSKRSLKFFEKKSEIKISGDVQLEFYNRREEQDEFQLRGCIEPVPPRVGKCGPQFQMDVQTNLKLDYRCDRVWGHGRLRFVNSLGPEFNLYNLFKCEKNCPGTVCSVDPQGSYGSGTCGDICLKKAFMGIHLYKTKKSRVDLIMGRRSLDDAFNSRIQFGDRFDGAEIHYSYDYMEKANFYFKVAPFIVDSSVDHYAFAAEIGSLNIFEKRFDICYSFIDWNLGRTACPPYTYHPRGWRFANSEIAIAYNFPMKAFKRKVKIFAEVIYNHAARATIITNNKRKPWAWCFGVVTGEKIKKGDWFMDVHYEMVQKNAISDCDINGIDRGKLSNRGKSNYKGLTGEIVYMVTDHLALDAAYDMATTADKTIDGEHRASVFEFDVIYSF